MAMLQASARMLLARCQMSPFLDSKITAVLNKVVHFTIFHPPLHDSTFHIFSHSFHIVVAVHIASSTFAICLWPWSNYEHEIAQYETLPSASISRNTHFKRPCYLSKIVGSAKQMSLFAASGRLRGRKNQLKLKLKLHKFHLGVRTITREFAYKKRLDFGHVVSFCHPCLIQLAILFGLKDVKQGPQLDFELRFGYAQKAHHSVAGQPWQSQGQS